MPFCAVMQKKFWDYLNNYCSDNHTRQFQKSSKMPEKPCCDLKTTIFISSTIFFQSKSAGLLKLPHMNIWNENYAIKQELKFQVNVFNEHNLTKL